MVELRARGLQVDAGISLDAIVCVGDFGGIARHAKADAAGVSRAMFLRSGERD